jgi:hypothetical protein
MEDKRPFWAECTSCDHRWAVAYLPMPIMVCADLMQRAMCPKCGCKELVVARQKDGVLAGAN